MEGGGVLLSLIAILTIQQGTKPTHLAQVPRSPIPLIDSNHTTTITLIARPLSRSTSCVMHGNKLCLFGAKALSPTHTVNVAHLT